MVKNLYSIESIKELCEDSYRLGTKLAMEVAADVGIMSGEVVAEMEKRVERAELVFEETIKVSVKPK